MKTKTLLELLTLASSLYYVAKDTHLIEKIEELSSKGKESINGFVSETQLDENGNELEFLDKLILKTKQAKEELETMIEESVVKFYKKVHIAHTDEILALNEKLEKLDRKVALLEARLNHLEVK